jgi:hypothetical protein
MPLTLSYIFMILALQTPNINQIMEYRITSAIDTIHLSHTSTSEEFQSYSSPSKFEDESKLIEEQERTDQAEIKSSKAIEILKRITDKLHGKEFIEHEVLDITPQVQRLIEVATAPENLSQCYIGWCSFW